MSIHTLFYSSCIRQSPTMSDIQNLVNPYRVCTYQSMWAYKEARTR
jgi:hypothetical protein